MDDSGRSLVDRRSVRRFEHTVLGVAGTVTLAIFSLYPPQGPVARYVAYAVVLPLTWVIALLLQGWVRRWIAQRYDQMDPSMRVLSASAVAFVVISYVVAASAFMPNPPVRR